MATNSPYTRCIRGMFAVTALLFIGVSPVHAQAPEQKVAPSRPAAGNTVAPPAAVLAKASAKRGPLVAEQRKHLRRLTKLNQLLVIAQQESNNELASRLDDLLKKEKERHIRHLMQLKIGKKILMTPPSHRAPAKE